MKIVVIDDSELMLGMFEMIAGQLSITLEKFENVPDEIPTADYVITDLNIPGVDDTVSVVRSRYDGPVIVMSGLAQDELDALELNVHATWSKDIGMMGLQQKLSELAGS